MARPATINNRWDVLYRDYPDVYEAFISIPREPGDLAWLTEEVDLSGLTVVDVGAGTGRVTVELARLAGQVIGVEPEPAMRRLAMARFEEAGLTNAVMLDGDAAHIPLAEGAADVVIAMTTTFYPASEVLGYVKEATRVLKPSGLIGLTEIAPGWYGGELESIIGHPVPEIGEKDTILRERLGFRFRDWDTIQDYGTTDNAVTIYGFIYGPNAIRHLQDTGMTKIRGRMRAYFRTGATPPNGHVWM